MTKVPKFNPENTQGLPSLDEIYMKTTGLPAYDSDKIVPIPLTRLEFTDEQIFQRHNDEKLQWLALNIKEEKVHQPAIVVPIEGLDKYKIYDGRNRFLASKIAGVETLPCIIYKSEEEAEAALIANNTLSRDKSIMEIALGHTALMKKYGLTMQQLADKLKVDRKNIYRYKLLADTHEWFHSYINEKKLPRGAAESISRCFTNKQQEELFVYLKDKLNSKKGVTDAQIKKLIGAFLDGRTILDSVSVAFPSKGKVKRAKKVQIPLAELSRWIPEGATNEEAIALILSAFEDLDDLRNNK